MHLHLFFPIDDKATSQKIAPLGCCFEKETKNNYWIPAKAVVPARVIVPAATRVNYTKSPAVPLERVLRVAVIVKLFAATTIPYPKFAEAFVAAL